VAEVLPVAADKAPGPSGASRSKRGRAVRGFLAPWRCETLCAQCLAPEAARPARGLRPAAVLPPPSCKPARAEQVQVHVNAIQRKFLGVRVRPPRGPGGPGPSVFVAFLLRLLRAGPARSGPRSGSGACTLRGCARQAPLDPAPPTAPEPPRQASATLQMAEEHAGAAAGGDRPASEGQPLPAALSARRRAGLQDEGGSVQ